MLCYCLLVVAVAVVVVDGQQQCQEQRNCSDCIQTPDCVWCSKPKAVEGKTDEAVVHYCQDKSSNLDSFCDPADLEDPQNDADIIENKPLTEITNKATRKGTSSEENIVQISPQKMKLKLRKGVPQNISIKYRLATDYPVDLYYLMDLSRSMIDDKENLAKLGSTLAELLSNLTSQYRLGFGSFVDKVLMPYADTSPEKLNQPCTDCAPPYSFRNDLKLNNDPALFTERVTAALISGNMDAPEGGFDALMQAMVCRQQIGWRDQARRIIIFSTDAKFHYAGDGRLAGIIVPNDETCHLNDENEYTDYDKYDYPSIAQIDKVSREKEINIIFAVTNHADLYEKLSDMVETSSFGLLEDGSGNVIDLVRKQYELLSSVVKLNDNSSSGLRIEYQSKCKGGSLISTKQCSNVKTGDTIEFFLQITANECPSDGATTIIEVKTLEDRLILEIEFECSCGCNKPDKNIPKAEYCNWNGTLVCGVCVCDQGYIGEKCQCSSDGSDGSEDQDQRRCKASENATHVCSDKGYCNCGSCVCRDPEVYGTYCNCNRRKCQSRMGEECSGHGKCQCNTCQCDTGFIGDLCQCPESSICIKPGSQDECSGHGECKCGKCKCRQEEGITYTGRYCEDCPTCGSGRCFDFRDCVQCQSFNSGPKSQDNSCSTCNTTSNLIDSLKGQQSGGASLCNFEDEEGCYFYFTYHYNSKTFPGKGTQLYDIYVQRERQCPPPPPVLGIVFGLIAAIVAIGFLTLIIWKIVTTIHDRREYAKFERERENATWNAEENPLYRGAQTTFQNPAFAQKQEK